MSTQIQFAIDDVFIHVLVLVFVFVLVLREWRTEKDLR